MAGLHRYSTSFKQLIQCALSVNSITATAVYKYTAKVLSNRAAMRPQMVSVDLCVLDDKSDWTDERRSTNGRGHDQIVCSFSRIEWTEKHGPDISELEANGGDTAKNDENGRASLRMTVQEKNWYTVIKIDDRRAKDGRNEVGLAVNWRLDRSDERDETDCIASSAVTAGAWDGDKIATEL